MRVLFVQYSGDLRETMRRFDKGGEETYYAQRYSVQTVADIGKRVEEVAFLVRMTAEPYSEVVSNGIRAIGGGGFQKPLTDAELVALVEQQQPTHLILTAPEPAVLKWAIRRKIPTIAVLADSFSNQGIRSRWQNFQLTRLLNHPQIEWVGNHNINASRSLQAIGVNPEKIVPWDWVSVVTPDAFAAKPLQPQGEWQLLFVGAMDESKGVSDVLDAVALLKAQNRKVKVRFAGKGDVTRFKERAEQLGIAEQATFLGLVPNAEIVPLMRSSDAVLIPSRHSYPEGLPMTIYEAFCSRTPIIASDHPMFRSKLVDRQNALIFEAENPAALAAAIEKLLSNSPLYEQLSIASAAAWEKLQIPVKFADLLNHWLFDPPQTPHWLHPYRLASGRYD